MRADTDIVARLSSMAADHGPDGWPAVRMRDITALCEEVTRLRAELAEAQQLARDDFDLRAEQRDERDRLRAALAQAGAGREPVGVLERGEGGAFKVRADMDNLPAIYSLPAGLHPLFAHPSPAQREPLSDAQIDSAPALTLAEYSVRVGRHELRQFARQIEAACAAAWGVKLADSGTKETAS